MKSKKNVVVVVVISLTKTENASFSILVWLQVWRRGGWGVTRRTSAHTPERSRRQRDLPGASGADPLGPVILPSDTEHML